MLEGVGGEMRFASGIAVKMRRLGALTKGDARATAGEMDWDSFNMDAGKQTHPPRIHFTRTPRRYPASIQSNSGGATGAACLPRMQLTNTVLRYTLQESRKPLECNVHAIQIQGQSRPDS